MFVFHVFHHFLFVLSFFPSFLLLHYYQYISTIKSTFLWILSTFKIRKIINELGAKSYSFLIVFAASARSIALLSPCISSSAPTLFPSPNVCCSFHYFWLLRWFSISLRSLKYFLYFFCFSSHLSWGSSGFLSKCDSVSGDYFYYWNGHPSFID